MPEVRDKLLAAGMIPTPSTPNALGATVRRELAAFGEVAKANGISAR